jgi:hypothetical protein
MKHRNAGLSPGIAGICRTQNNGRRCSPQRKPSPIGRAKFTPALRPPQLERTCRSGCKCCVSAEPWSHLSDTHHDRPRIGASCFLIDVTLHRLREIRTPLLLTRPHLSIQIRQRSLLQRPNGLSLERNGSHCKLNASVRTPTVNSGSKVLETQTVSCPPLVKVSPSTCRTSSWFYPIRINPANALEAPTQ